MSLSPVAPGYASFDGYNGFNNYSFGNGMFDERMRGDRGGRGKVQNSISDQLMFENLPGFYLPFTDQLAGLALFHSVCDHFS